MINKMLKHALLLFAAVCMVFTGSLLLGQGAYAEATTISVSSVEDLKNAVNTINAASEGEYVISLEKDIETTSGMGFSSAAEKTILGNGHTLHYTGSDSYIVLDCGTLNLGNGNGNVLSLTTQGMHGDDCTFIHVRANARCGESGYHPVLNMYDGVTVSGFQTDHSLGGAVRVYPEGYDANELPVFNMYGGVIENCSIVSGSNRYGGGVFVQFNGEFNMYGGTIKNCSAWLGGGVSLDDYGAGAAPKFTMTGGTITGNTASYYGGGVYVPRGTFSLEGGAITENTAMYGGGIFAGGNGIVNISDGSITKNTAQQCGGGIYDSQPLSMTGGILCNNTAGAAGSDVYATKAVTLPSASGMDQKFRDTQYTIDGWYNDFDYHDDEDDFWRWDKEEAFKGESSKNSYENDIINDSGMVLIAAFTARDDIPVKILWVDDTPGPLPESVTVNLLANGGVIQSISVAPDGSGNWKYTFTGLSKYDANGDEIAYTVTENTVTGYKTEITGSAAAGFTITNTRDITQPIPGRYDFRFAFTKVWQGDREDSIDWTLYHSDGTVAHKLFNKTVVSGNEWLYEAWFEADGDFSVIENVPKGYKVRYENVGAHAGDTDRCYNGGKIINYKIPKTGDGEAPLLWSALAAAGLIGLAAAAYGIRRRRAKQS